MARGGARKGAGRPKGSGVGKPARKTSERIKITQEAIGEGMTPLEYMLTVMRTSKDDKRRDAMAAAAAPYVHPRLASTNVTMDDKRTLAERSAADLERELEQARRDLAGIVATETGFGEPDQVH